MPEDATTGGARTRPLTRDEARERAALIRDVAYDVTLDLTHGDARFVSDTTIRFRCDRPGSEVIVDLFAPALRGATLNGEELATGAFDGTALRLPPLASDNVLRVVAECAYSRDGNGLHLFRDPVDGEIYLYSDCEPREAHRIFACFDQPDIKARFTFSVRARAGWTVLSNEPAVDRPSSGEGGLWRFAESKPISTYISAVCAGPYHGEVTRHGSIDLGVWCRRSLAPSLDADEIFEITRQGFDFFEEYFAYPYPFAKYDQVFVPEFNSGAMENAGCVTFNESMVFRSRATEAQREARAETILHEMAHMWFGDLVTMRWWDDLWLNESFATYMATLSAASATRFRHAWVTFARAQKLWASTQDQLPTTHPIVADVPDTDAARVNFDGISYAKGASVLKQLVAWAGEEAFVKGVRNYFRRHEFGNADLRAFLGAVEEASGRDLGAWAAQWLETTGINTIRLERTPSLEVRHSGSPLRPHRIAIGAYDAGGETIVRTGRVELDVDGEGAAVEGIDPGAALLLPNDDDLSYAKIKLDPESFALAADRLSSLEDPLARILVWNASWEQLFDGELPASTYVRHVLRHALAEPDVGVAQNLLERAVAAASFYAARPKVRPLLDEIAAAMIDAARALPAGSDHQLAAARVLIAAARSDAHLGVLRSLLDGATDLPGLAMDEDLRWRIVRTLALQGRDEGLVEREASRDQSDAGQRNALAARAARPDAGSKAEAWTAVIEDESMSLATMCSILVGQPFVSYLEPVRRMNNPAFGSLEHAEVLEPYRERYFERILPVWAERPSEVALKFAAGAFPLALVDEALVPRIDAFLTSAAPPAPIRRVLLEGREHAVRALRARVADGE